jgi:hypothetical protein
VWEELVCRQGAASRTEPLGTASSGCSAMNRQLANFSFEEASKTFAFLVDEYGFAPPRLEINDKINFAFVIFLGKNLAVECILDEREEDITCKIARVIGGKPAVDYAIDDNGVRVREGLYNLLVRRGVRGQLITPVRGLEFRERIKIKLADCAQMLRKHGQDIWPTLQRH